MRKLYFLFLMLVLYLTFPCSARSEYYVIRLHNGGALATPLCWSEGGLIYFFWAGGTVGVEKQTVERVEKLQGTRNFTLTSESGAKETKELSPLTSPAEKLPGPEKLPASTVLEEKVNIADYKSKKDKLTANLEELMDKRSAARQNQDKDTEEKLTMEIRNTSSTIYGITDEVTAKNKGKLPEGWWDKK